MTHYMDIVIKDGHIMHELHARLLFITHQLVTGDTPVPCHVDFPGYSQRAGLGFVFRAFASADALEAFALKAAPLSNTELVRCMPIHRVPENVKEWVLCRKVRPEKLGGLADKPSPSWLRRLKRRAEARGEVFNEAEARQHWEAKSKKGKYDMLPYVPMASFSTNTKFYLSIERKLVSQPDAIGAGGGYGLGTAVPLIERPELAS